MKDRGNIVLPAILLFLLVVTLGLFFWSVRQPLSANVRQTAYQEAQTSTGRYIPSIRSQEKGCTYEGSGSLPDPECTPGALFLDITAKDVCLSGYSRSVRDVSQSLKEKVYRNYGVTQRKPGEYQIDHLIDLQLGGANDISNLWPQPDVPLPGANEKIKLGGLLNRMVCQGKMQLQDAQEIMSRNWVEGYRRLMPGAL